MHTSIIDTTDNTFTDNIINNKGLTLVMFWAPWCGHCTRMMPTVEKLVQTYASQLTVCRINIEENSKTADAFEVNGTPTFILFKNGDVLDELIGESPLQELEQFIDKHL